jgi:hypothetical protein
VIRRPAGDIHDGGHDVELAADAFINTLLDPGAHNQQGDVEQIGDIVDVLDKLVGVVCQQYEDGVVVIACLLG